MDYSKLPSIYTLEKEMETEIKTAKNAQRNHPPLNNPHIFVFNENWTFEEFCDFLMKNAEQNKHFHDAIGRVCGQILYEKGFNLLAERVLDGFDLPNDGKP